MEEHRIVSIIASSKVVYVKRKSQIDLTIRNIKERTKVENILRELLKEIIVKDFQ